MLIEDVLSRKISKLFARGMMSTMVTRKGISPTHLFFADDILIFCKGNMRSLRNLFDLLSKYQVASGQTVSRAKSKLYYGGGSNARKRRISDFMGIEAATFPDRSLGVQLMPGAVRYAHVRPVVEKIMDKLAGWVGIQLSFQARVVLVKSVISSYSIHTMAIYKWPLKIITQCERAIKNFLWTGDAKKRKALVVSFEKICSPYCEGGLGLSKLEVVNKAMLMKLWWNIKNSTKKWAQFMRAKFLKINGDLIDYKLKSSIMPGIRWIYEEVEKHTRCLVGDGRNTSLFFDNWCGAASLAQNMGIPSAVRKTYTAKASGLIVDGNWAIPDSIKTIMEGAGVVIQAIPKPSGDADTRVWTLDKKGQFTVKSARLHLRKKYEPLPEASLVWKSVVHPAMSAQYWKLMHSVCCTTSDRVQRILQIPLVSRCVSCNRDGETLNHILWDCSFAERVWDWIVGIFAIQPHHNLVQSYKSAKGKSRMFKDLWLVANIAIRCELWRRRNKLLYDNQTTHWTQFKMRVYTIISNGSIRMKGHMFNNCEELRVLNYFGVRHRSVKQIIPIECSWRPPDQEELLLCCDGASAGNPGDAGAGIVARHSDCRVIGALCLGLGITTNYIAETLAVISGWARKWSINRVIVRSDSASVIQAFTKGSIPWFFRQRWLAIKASYDSIRFEHAYREIHFAADTMAKRGSTLAMGVTESYDGRPDFLHSVEGPDRFYYRLN